jgi:hypothetical protein
LQFRFLSTMCSCEADNANTMLLAIAMLAGQ